VLSLKPFISNKQFPLSQISLQRRHFLFYRLGHGGTKCAGWKVRSFFLFVFFFFFFFFFFFSFFSRLFLVARLGDQKKDPLLVDSGKGLLKRTENCVVLTSFAGMYKPFERDADDAPEQAGGCSSMVKSCNVM
jgi:hypothetical protein